MNAFSRQVQEELKDCAGGAARRLDVRVVAYGGEKVFVLAGADIKEMAGMSYEMAPIVRRLSACFGALSEIPKPTVAAITGYALGGGMEVALGCDRRVLRRHQAGSAGDPARGDPRGGGGTQRMARLIGTPKTKDLIFTGRMVGAAGGRLEIGLVDQAGGRGLRHGPGLGRPVRERPGAGAGRGQEGDRRRAGHRPGAPGWTWRRSCSLRCSAPRTAASAWSRSWPTGRARPEFTGR